MTEVSPDQLKQAVESQHGGTATFAQSVPVHEEHGGQVVWDGTVHVFDLADHPKATRAYAWSSPVEGSAKRRFFAVLHMGGITGPVEAVRAAIVAEQRCSTCAGEGKVPEIQDIIPAAHPPEISWTTCPSCGGTGLRK